MKTTIAQHTPTPLRAEKDKGAYEVLSCDRLVAEIGSGGCCALDAAFFIVRAVNEYDSLVARVRSLENEQEELLSALKRAKETIHATWTSRGLGKDDYLAELFETVSQAIAKAKGRA